MEDLDIQEPVYRLHQTRAGFQTNLAVFLIMMNTLKRFASTAMVPVKLKNNISRKEIKSNEKNFNAYDYGGCDNFYQRSE